MKNNRKKKCGKVHLRSPVLRPVRFTPKIAYNRQKFKNKKEWE